MTDRSDFESRLDELREEAERRGRVDDPGVHAEGGPMPAPSTSSGSVGYHGRPVVKAPVWTWEIPVYLFVGGAAGMAAVIALAAAIAGRAAATRLALLVAVAGALVSPLLLIVDLGRPARFLNMLRVFKHRSPMSIGVWTLVAFTLFVVPATTAAHLEGGVAVLWWLLPPAAALGALLATYTGVLLAATSVPVWATHRVLLPVHFGVAGLGSAAAILELLGLRLTAVHLLGLLAAAIETLLLAAVEIDRRRPVDRPLREGRSGVLMRLSGILAGPLALGLRLFDAVAVAAVAFLVGALVSRFAWLEAGRASARDPAAALTPER